MFKFLEVFIRFEVVLYACLISTLHTQLGNANWAIFWFGLFLFRLILSIQMYIKELRMREEMMGKFKDWAQENHPEKMSEMFEVDEDEAE